MSESENKALATNGEELGSDLEEEGFDGATSLTVLSLTAWVFPVATIVLYMFLNEHLYVRGSRLLVLVQ